MATSKETIWTQLSHSLFSQWERFVECLLRNSWKSVISMKSGRNHRVREERMIRLSSLPLRRHSWIWWELPLACNVCICVFVFLVKLIDCWRSGIHITAMCRGTSGTFHMLIVSVVSCAIESTSVCLCVCVCACYLNWCFVAGCRALIHQLAIQSKFTV